MPETISQTFPGIRFFNQNANNDIIANTINSDLTPTEELAQPELNLLEGTITLTEGGLIVDGSLTVFTTQVQIGELITALDGSGIAYLIGEVESIQSDVQFTLKSNGPSPIAGTGLQFASTRSFIKPSANIYMMVPTLVLGDTFYVPTPKGLRVGYTDNVGALMDSGVLAFSQYSESLIPNVELNTLVDVPCYVVRKTTVPIGIPSVPVVKYQGNIPLNYWYLITGAGKFIQNTSFQIYTEEVFDSFLVEDGVTFKDLAKSDTQYNTGGYF
jgi:hypothetical protein